jgi:hypothetical protein
MKKILKILVGVVIVVAVLLIGLQVFLNRGLNPVVQKALPQVSESLGLDAAVENVSINLFGGSLEVKNVKLGNPQGFKEPSVFALDSTSLDVSLRALLDGIVQVSDASVKNAKITIVRNAAGAVNLTEIQKQLPKSDVPAETEAKPQTEQKEDKESKPEAAESVKIPKVQIDKLAFNTLFEFVDYKTTNAQPNRLGIDLSIDAADVVTFGELPEEEWGALNIKGGLHEKPDQFVVDIKAKVAPLTDPAALSFRAEGSIAAMDMTELGDVSQEIGISAESADIAITLIVDKGVFGKGSKMVAALRNAELVGDLKKKNKKAKLPPNISITIPVSGTLANPKINIVQAVTSSLLRNIAENPDYLLDNVTVDGKSLRDRLNKAFGGGKKK